MGAAAGAMMLAGGILGAANDMQQGQAASAQDSRNAMYARMAASDALQRGTRTVGLVRSRGTQTIGAEKTGYAASGVDLASGTPAATMAGTRAMSELDAATARNNAAREAWGYQVQASNHDRQASLDSQRGTFGAMGSILGGVGSFAGQYGRDLAGDPYMRARMSGARATLPSGAGDFGSLGLGTSGRGYA